MEPGGSTNLYAGLMPGFQELDRNFDVRRNNRIILLTDGIANVGIIDPNQIASAKSFNDRGIYLSTIGLGHDFNDRLLSQLATQGRGGYHFVDSAEEMDKIFRQEVSGLMQKAASDVSVVIRPKGGVSIDAPTGYPGRPPQPSGGSWSDQLINPAPSRGRQLLPTPTPPVLEIHKAGRKYSIRGGESKSKQPTRGHSSPQLVSDLPHGAH